VGDEGSVAVKMVLDWRLRAGAQPRFEPLLQELVAHAGRADGLQGSSVFTAGDRYLLLLRFRGHADLERWRQAPAVVERFAAIAPLVAEAEQPQRRTGLETWFTLPGQRAATETPPQWKMALVTWCALLPQVLVLALVVPPMPLVLSVAVTTAIPVALLTWVVMPRATNLLARWLYPRSA
jgi:antibiotic biosynthesis monooxygenase (ABM) superfamily enzyme